MNEQTLHPCKSGPGGSPCRRARLGEAFDINKDCHICWKFAHEEEYNRAWGGGGRVFPVKGGKPNLLARFAPKPCLYLRKQTGETRTCKICTGTIQVPLFNCVLHRHCTTDKLIGPDVQCCRICPDYKQADGQQLYPPVTTRHLLFHFYPAAGTGGVWQRWVSILRRRMALFNGRRAIGIVTGPGLDPPEKVQEAFKGEIDDWIITSNNSRLREVKTFLPLWKQVKSDNPHEATFYGHSKGSTKPVNPGITSHPWGRVMYETCLDYWPYVERLLQKYPVVGSFKKTNGPWGSCDWHYSGTFYWIRNAELFKRNWLKVDMTWWGTETYPGAHFQVQEAGCIFYEQQAHLMNLYEMPYWNGRVWPAYRKWREEYGNEKTDWAALAEATARDRQRLKETMSV